MILKKQEISLTLKGYLVSISFDMLKTCVSREHGLQII